MPSIAVAVDEKSQYKHAQNGNQAGKRGGSGSARPKGQRFFRYANNP
jgi:hypothetical protein